MRYKLDVDGYVLAVAFGCYLDGCTEYTGTVPIGYNSLDDWATYSCVQAYYIDDNGNLALDQEKLAKCRRKEAQDKIDNAPVVRKDLYESEKVLESQYIKATVTGQTINLTDAKVLPPRIKITGVDPSAYSDITLYVSNGTDTRDYTILLEGLESVDYILIEKGSVIASVNGTEEIIGEGHIRLFEGVCNIYASEVVTIEIEYSTNVQDVENLKFLQGKETTTKRFKILEDGSIEANNGKFFGDIQCNGKLFMRSDAYDINFPLILTDFTTEDNQIIFQNIYGEPIMKWTEQEGFFIPEVQCDQIRTTSGADMDKITGYESNANGRYWKFPDGTLICTKIVTWTGAVNAQWGSMYESDLIELGNWAYEFSGSPDISITCGTDAQYNSGIKNALPQGMWGVSKKSAGQTMLMRPVSTGVATYYLHVRGIGRWK